MKQSEMKTTRHNAIAKCQCGNYLVSTGGGRFVSCSTCGDFIDQERWNSLYVRIGGMATIIEQICHKDCSCRDHDLNKKFDNFLDLKRYMKKTYNYKLIP